MEHDSSFYRELASFRDFSRLADPSTFVRVPDSWSVIITDVKGSTRAIKEGRYGEVNLIGAASITCVLNRAGEIEIPFVFGGDGATLLVPNQLLPSLAKELQGLQMLAKNDFGLELRVGHVSMSRARDLGADLSVAKYELSPANTIAQFKGGAITLAEDMVKKGHPEGAVILHPAGDENPPQLTGLSCRLQPLENRQGVILSLLIKPQGIPPDENLRLVLGRLKNILNGDFLSARPVSLDRMKWTWPPKSLASEVITQSRDRLRLIQWVVSGIRTLISAILLKYDLPLGRFEPRKYKSELVTNSDFKKYDETLRMVIDCTPQQAAQIETFLAELRKEQRIIYGIHRSARALMTCLVKSSTANRHMTFPPFSGHKTVQIGGGIYGQTEES
ncbi:MAG: hypothetical protein C5B49_02240, partial [Bdellovibrio sp.]